MTEIPLDRIHIRGLLVRCIVGINDDERVNKQDVRLSVTLHADLRGAGASDDIDDTVNYKGIKQRLFKMVEASEYFLIERLADEVARVCLADPRVKRADVVVDKPGALRFAESVAVEITRFQEG
jgi:FolB domain-containing protein